MINHKCQCGRHENPGRIVFKLGRLIFVHVDAPNGNFWEFRWLNRKPLAAGCFLETEDLLLYWKT